VCPLVRVLRRDPCVPLVRVSGFTLDLYVAAVRRGPVCPLKFAYSRASTFGFLFSPLSCVDRGLRRIIHRQLHVFVLPSSYRPENLTARPSRSPLPFLGSPQVFGVCIPFSDAQRFINGEYGDGQWNGDT